MNDEIKKQILQDIVKKMTLNHYTYSEEYHIFNTSNLPFTDVNRDKERESLTALLKSYNINFEVKEDETIHILTN